ncbi:Pentatricopeptide repeat-containing protein [Acorus gramineus]|uniref:Pentatricopeptide repeat-containing protein n=1 Tax=Acorus gramineus TaxID=55184 RepID=A0AAV9AR83_ACOGR|nr:Pentatricopeptide repeat-containing protein [Acorus gramineus]
MRRLRTSRTKIPLQNQHFNKKSISTKTPTTEEEDPSDPTKKLCKLILSSPRCGLETALDASHIKVSPATAESVLTHLSNAGIQSYRFFEWASKQRAFPSHTVRAHHSVIDTLARVRQYALMWGVVDRMRDARLLTVETFCAIMRRYARAGRPDEAVYAFNVMGKYGVDPNEAAFNGLLSALCKAKHAWRAQEIFDSAKSRFAVDAKTYSILIEGWGRVPNLVKAREMFDEMLQSGCEPDIVTYGIMVDALCKAGRIGDALGVVRDMGSKNCKPTSFIYSVLVHAHGAEGRVKDAVDAFLEMERSGIVADVAVYNALIGAFCRASRFGNAFKVLAEMEKRGVSPNARTCNVILNRLIGVGRNEDAFKVFRRMIRRCEPDSDTYTMMIKMFCGKGELGMAMKVWKYMGLKRFAPSMHTFSVMIKGLCEAGEARQAAVLMEEMLEKGIQPHGTTFGRLRQLLLKEGREDVVQFLSEKMKTLIKDPLWD